MRHLFKFMSRSVAVGGLLVLPLVYGQAAAEGIVAKIVNSPLNSAGLVKNGYAALNVYLQKPSAQGIEFFNPEVPGFGIPPGGRIEVEMGGGFTRDASIKMDTGAIHMVSGTPQHGLSDRIYGYLSHQGANPNTFVVTALTPAGLPAETLLPRASVKKLDPIPNVGLKVFHIGLSTIAFVNNGDKGSVTVRIIDGNGQVRASGTAEVDFWDEARPAIHPNNFMHKGRNHNWQRINKGDTLGRTPGTVPLTFMLFDKPTGTPRGMINSKQGIVGAGVLSSKQLAEMGFQLPAELKRYTAGLILKDVNGDGRLDPKADRILGGVMADPKAGAGINDIRSPAQNGAPMLSQPTSTLSQRAGKRFGGAIMQVQFQAGNRSGTFRPTFAFLKNPDDRAQGDGTSYTYTIIVR